MYFSCVLGFFGEPLTPGGNCSRCRCNNNSDVCNRTTGECINCQHNTTGFYCERCENGTWGNATEQQCQGSLHVNSHVVKRGIVSDQDLPVGQFRSIERFSFECRKVIGFAFTMLRDLRHFFIQSEAQPKPIVTRSHACSRALRQLHVIRVLIGSLYCLCSL